MNVIRLKQLLFDKNKSPPGEKYSQQWNKRPPSGDKWSQQWDKSSVAHNCHRKKKIAHGEKKSLWLNGRPKNSLIGESQLIQTIVCRLGKVKRSWNDWVRLVYAGLRGQTLSCDTKDFFPVTVLKTLNSFETGREHFACQDSGVSQTFIRIIPYGEKVLSNVNVVVWRREKASEPQRRQIPNGYCWTWTGHKDWQIQRLNLAPYQFINNTCQVQHFTLYHAICSKYKCYTVNVCNKLTLPCTATTLWFSLTFWVSLMTCI